MKKAFVVLLIILMNHNVSAQAALIAIIFGDKVATEKFHIGLELGAHYSSISEVNGSNGSIGVKVGTSANIKLSEAWSLNPTIYFFSQRRAKIDALSLNSNDDELNDNFQYVPATLKVNYIDIPFFVNYQIKESNFKIGFAPQVSFRISSNGVFKNVEGDFEFDEKEQTNGIDFGLIGQIGYILKSKNLEKEMHVHLRYFQGFTDVYKNNFLEGDNTFNYFGLALSFPFK